MEQLDGLVMRFLDDWRNVVGTAALAFLLVVLWVFRQQVLFYPKFMLKSLRRNLLRTSLTGLATVVLVFVVTLVWTVLYFLDLVTAEKSKDLKAIVTERWQIPSQMPLAYETDLAEGAAASAADYKVDPAKDAMTWQFYGGTIDPAKRTRENIVFFFCMEPAKLLRLERDANNRPTVDPGAPGLSSEKRLLLAARREFGMPVSNPDGNLKYNSMMDGIDELTDEQIELLDAACREMARDKTKVVVGQERLAAMKKRVGERIKVTSMNYLGIDLEVEVLAAFPPGRYDQSAVMNRDYLNNALLDAYPRSHNGQKHPLADKTLNLVWLRVPDTATYQRVAAQIEGSAKFKNPAVKSETASSGVASFLDAYRDLLWGMRWLLVPAILITMSLVIANAIGISVRERRGEMAVLKVLGFRPGQVMALVLGEALLIGSLSGLLSAAGAYWVINKMVGGIAFPVAFFPKFMVPWHALWWGPMIGGLTALAGSLLPSWSARSVKVSEVFSKIS
jgi:putative ABC transport system permease protein